ncbi:MULTISPECIES: ATP-binding cassette domain-containing protein [unclassified Clostridium]|uniref:ATP-binding cassette domain-containing protein n=1 Tax=unclassified Clostridium TaxID=2614128 RepID=UPI0025C02BC9|nr:MULTISPECIES: ATP-binding cassette domain-containing protein [unclassified Clostridium]
MNVDYYLTLYNIKIDYGLHYRLIDELNIKKYENYIFKNLSEGTKQKTRLIITLLQKNNLILLDEPTNYLDEKSILKLSSYINNSNSKFIIFLFL